MEDIKKRRDEHEEINIIGERGESLFYFADLRVINYKKIQDDIQKNLNDYSSRYASINDDRALAIIGALSIENELDKFLSLWLADYAVIEKQLRFDHKIKLSISAKLMPKWILESIAPIQQIRNTFAHNLDVNSFAEAKRINSGAFGNMYKKIKNFFKWENKDDRETFKQLIFFILLGINVYMEHVKKVIEYIWDEKKLNFDILWEKR